MCWTPSRRRRASLNIRFQGYLNGSLNGRLGSSLCKNRYGGSRDTVCST
jgi:hypothetical protein